MSSLKDLNPEQRQAVESRDKAVMIIAGPGTGKTKTLTARIVHLIQIEGVRPPQILAMTFTKKAAREMQERVSAVLGAKVPQITTIHGFCHDLVGGKQGFEFISETERLHIIRGLKKPHNFSSLTVRELGLEISKAKNEIAIDDPDMQLLVTEYNKQLAAKGLHDFDDLLQLTYQELISKDAPKLRFTHVLLDEFQDTNRLQYEIARLISSTASLFVIGDPLQSIYGFRGADAGIFQQFAHDFPHVRTYSLSINYRSSKQVVRLANAIFPNASKLRAHSKTPGSVRGVQVFNEYSEAAFILETIEQAVGGSTMQSGHDRHMAPSGHAFGDFAIISRTHAVAKTVQRLFNERGIPLQVVGEGSPYQTSEVMEIIKGLQYLHRPEKNNLLDQLLRKVDATQPASSLVVTIAQKMGFDIAKKPAIMQFANLVARFDKKNLAACVEYIEAIAEQDFYDETADAVTLLTIHASKGLEFTHVFLIGAEEGILPLARKGEKGNIEEEKRLFYVAVTRARMHLDILYAHTRAKEKAKQSRFITELPAHVLVRQIDERFVRDEMKAKKRQAKRAQAALF